MRAVRILDGEIVETEFFLHLPQQRLVRLVQPDPHQGLTLLEDFAGLFERDLANASAAAICNAACDAHGDRAAIARRSSRWGGFGSHEKLVAEPSLEQSRHGERRFVFADERTRRVARYGKIRPLLDRSQRRELDVADDSVKDP